MKYIKLFFLMIIALTVVKLENCFAVEVGVFTEGLPSTFTSNFSVGGATINYFSQAAGSSYQELQNNFKVVSNYRTSDNVIPLYLLMKNKYVPTRTETITVDNIYNPTKINDNGINYIITHGYNNTNELSNIFSTKKYGQVNDKNVQQYLTQIALWVYIFEHNSSYTDSYCINNSCYFYKTIGTATAVASISEVRNAIKNVADSNANYNYLNYILDLVDSANSAGNDEESSMNSIILTKNDTINENKKYIVTDLITPSPKTNTDNFMYYSVEIENPNNYDVYLVDKNDKKITNTTKMKDSFKVYVSIKDDITTMDFTSVKVNIYGYFIKKEGYTYRVTSSTTPSDTRDNLIMKSNGSKVQKYSDLIIGLNPYEIVKTTFNLRNFVKISKIDITNSKELPGAKLVITDLNDKENKYSWTSTNEAHYVYLANGEYELCETIAPEGYSLSTECIKFSVDNKKVLGLTMKNAPKPDVPNTSKFFAKLTIIISWLLIISGIVLSIRMYSKQKNM